LAEVAGRVHGIDISPEMLDYCRRALPGIEFEERDLTEVGGLGDARFTAIFAPFNIISILDHEGRMQAFDAFARILRPGGLLVFSAHNRAFTRLHSPAWVISRDPRTMLSRVRHLPESVRNRRRMRPLERSEAGYALVNDLALNFSLLHYYILRDDQERQLAQHGFTLLECLDRQGRPVAPGEVAAHDPELHYVARKV
jgi:SAM-dependent methyltransferase